MNLPYYDFFIDLQEELTDAEHKSIDRAWAHGDRAGRLVRTFVRAERTIAIALGVPRENSKVQLLLRIQNWFVGSNRDSERNLNKLITDVLRRATSAKSNNKIAQENTKQPKHIMK